MRRWITSEAASAYKVVVLAPALRDIAAASDFIALESPTEALRWAERLLEEIRSLSELPLRFPVSPLFPEARRRPRAFVFESFRVFYRIVEDEAVVEILRVWHTARREPDVSDLA